jgi:putative beta-1,4-xylosyltransferase IRX10
MKGWWVLPISILSVASAAALLLGAEAQSVQQGHQAERISGEGPLLADLASDLR